MTDDEIIARMFRILQEKRVPETFIKDALVKEWGHKMIRDLPGVSQYANFLFSMPEGVRLQLAMSHIRKVHEELSDKADAVVNLLRSDPDLFSLIKVREDIKAVM